MRNKCAVLSSKVSQMLVKAFLRTHLNQKLRF